MRTSFSLVACLIPISLFAADADPSKVFPSGEKCPDSRLGAPKTLNSYFPFTPPATKDGWNDRARQVRIQLLVANGLWPMPEKTPLNPVIHGKIERDGYTIEKFYFASMPGHYVTGNLYRPTAKVDGKHPAVLTPHGHWANGRLFEAPEATVKKELDSKAEATPESARYPLQARCAMLARLGFVTFHYDMVGYADSKAITHREGFTDAEAELRSQSFMGLQTWNSIRALDFLSALEDVDPKRIAVTGASGGGTQTFILCAIDDRPAAAFPAVMVSTGMQGGCVCENCSHLRVGTGNVEIAGVFAPKPLGMSAAKDWTFELETKGFPELKQLYKLLGAEDMVAAKSWLEFGHNYNQTSREFMYSWFNQHILKQKEAVKELPFKPVPPMELSVFDDKHPRPTDELNAADLRKKMTEAAEKQLKALEPADAKSLAQFRSIVGPALRAMVHDSLPSLKDVEWKEKGAKQIDGGIEVVSRVIGRKGHNEAIPAISLITKESQEKGRRIVLWIHPKGKASLFENGKVVPAAQAILAKGATIMAIDVFQTGELVGEKPFTIDPKFAGFTYGYNRSIFAQRVHDILTAIRFTETHGYETNYLIGWEEAGPWVAAARALAGDSIKRTAIDMNQFRFDNVKSTSDEMLLPGALRFGGVPAFVGLCAPYEVLAHNHAGTHIGSFGKAAYEAAGAEAKLTRSPMKMKDTEVVAWLLK